MANCKGCGKRATGGIVYHTECDCKHSSWKSVEELPTEVGAYLVYKELGNMKVPGIAWFTTNYNGFIEEMRGRAVWFDYNSEWGDYEIRNVKYWMPIPELP